MKRTFKFLFFALFMTMLFLTSEPVKAGGVYTSPNWHPKATLTNMWNSIKSFFTTPYWSGQ